MGSDISGWVEIQHRPGDGYFETWTGVIKIDEFVERAYGMFGNLFGHRDIGGFAPIAANRGIPSDRSNEVADSLASYGQVDPSWILWREIAAIDWEEEGEEEILDGHGVGRKARRKDTLTPAWSTLFHLMEVLAGAYGDEHVRLVVWFDS